MTDTVQPVGVDFHCHLDLYPDHQAAILKAEAERIYTLAVTTTPKAWKRNRELACGTRFVRVALGLHPQLVADRAGELPLWERHLPEARYVGEVGLDASPRFVGSFGAQKEVFRKILERCAEAGGRVLSVHSVRCARSVIEMIERYLPRDRGAVVLHWFSGSRTEAFRAVELGCYFSVNGEMTRSKRGCALVADLPLDRLLTETDGPFTQIGGRPAEPADVGAVSAAIARVRNLSVDSFATAVRTNLKTLLRLNIAKEAR